VKGMVKSASAILLALIVTSPTTMSTSCKCNNQLTTYPPFEIG
jgi:hypothetical protein